MAFSSTLAKGQACLDCRRRKIKCDGIRPICGPCYRAERFDDCEYRSNNKAPSKMQRIEESISLVEHRIMDFEKYSGSQLPAAVNLRPPYTNVREPRTTASKHVDASSPQMLQFALEAIAPRADEIGFFLNRTRFRNTCFGMVSGHERLPAALMTTVCLWAACVSPAESVHSLEDNFLSQALKSSTTILGSSHRLKILYGMQTEVLLCQYFLHKGRLVEAQYHLSLAVSYVVLGDLAHIASRPRSAASQLAFLDSIEEGEHIIGYWTVLALDKIWSSVLNFPSHFGSEPILDVDTPWPAEMEAYERNRTGHTFRPINTVQAFIEHVPGVDHKETSYLTILAKAGILLDRANVVSRQWQPHMSSMETAAYSKTFSKLNERITKFRDSLPPPNALANCPPGLIPRVVLAHSVAHAATIQLNRHFLGANAQCRELGLAACRSIVWIISSANLRNIGHINPIVSTIWSAAAVILLEEIARVRGIPEAAAEVADMRRGYDEIVSCIAHFARDSSFMREFAESSFFTED
ncbi:hypothetical protein C8F01DRAFT_1251149 [Mycena amicta]|nr:hypothetical protein C8F01DRAFT_1251149 [Mycena amicta]